MTAGFHTLWLDSVDSTNSEALRRLPSLPSGTVLAAVEQTAGRGQRGNTWFSETGKNLTFSVVLKSLDFPAAEAFRLNCLCSVAVSDFLSAYGIASSVKWPNDIYVSGRKICGMLLENGLSDGSVAYSVMGIGINVNQTEFPNLANATSVVLEVHPARAEGNTPSVAENKADAPSVGSPSAPLLPPSGRPEVDQVHPSLDQVHFHPLDQVHRVCPSGPSRAEVLDQVQPMELDLVQCLEAFLEILSGWMPQLRSAELFGEYERRLYRRGTSARYRDLLKDEDFEGIIRGVDPDGRLRIEDAGGFERLFRFKELSFIL